MNIILYGIPADTAELIAGRYDLELIHSIEEIGACGALLPVPKITAPRQLLALYNALMRHEDAIDAVIICGSETCGAAGTICYGAPPGKIFTLCGDPGGEELEAELFRLLDAIFTQANRINLGNDVFPKKRKGFYFQIFFRHEFAPTFSAFAKNPLERISTTGCHLATGLAHESKYTPLRF